MSSYVGYLARQAWREAGYDEVIEQEVTERATGYAVTGTCADGTTLTATAGTDGVITSVGKGGA